MGFQLPFFEVTVCFRALSWRFFIGDVAARQVQSISLCVCLILHLRTMSVAGHFLVDLFLGWLQRLCTGRHDFKQVVWLYVVSLCVASKYAWLEHRKQNEPNSKSGSRLLITNLGDVARYSVGFGRPTHYCGGPQSGHFERIFLVQR